MIKKFSVKNFKNFQDELVLDFSKVRDYEFNKSLIKNGLVNKALIYGLNNCGKSNLGAAIMDITMHLTDNKGNENKIYNYYVNGNNYNKTVIFKYEFLFRKINLMAHYYAYGEPGGKRLQLHPKLLFKLYCRFCFCKPGFRAFF